MSDKWCPAGKCECGRYSVDDGVAFCEQEYSREMDFEKCPWPSRQVPVKQPLSDCDKCPKDDAYAAGRLAVIGECIGEIKKMITPLDLDDESDYWRSVVLNETIAALEKLRDK